MERRLGLYRPKEIFANKGFQFAIEVDFSLMAFKDYIQLTENKIEKIKEELNTFQKEYNSAPEDKKEEVFYSYDYSDLVIKENIQAIYYSSILITIYSFLEKKLFQLCQLAEPGSKLKINDLSGKGIFKYKRYLSKVHDIDFTDLENEWQFITKFNKLRNDLVHDYQSKVDSKKARIYSSIDESLVRETSEGEFIVELLDSRVLYKFIEVVKVFLYDTYHRETYFVK